MGTMVHKTGREVKFFHQIYGGVRVLITPINRYSKLLITMLFTQADFQDFLCTLMVKDTYLGSLSDTSAML